MRHISLLIKPASSMCNMRCRYCFYADEAESRETASYGLMSEDTARRVLSAAASELKSGDCLSIAFQGGEPTLAGIDFFRSFFRMADELLPGISLNWAFQTNGLVLDDAWCALLRERNVLVGLSVDGGAEIHNANRPDAAGKGTYARVHAAMECLRTHGVQFNILSVLTAGMARHPTAAWNWLKRERVDYVQFIPCLDRLEAETPSPYALTPARFQSFYRQLFPLWKKHLEEGGFVSVKFFDDLINLYLGGHATACGMTGRCAIQYVVEANGDVFPCDFYVLDRYRMGSLLTDTPEALRANAAGFLADGRDYVKNPPCRDCRHLQNCGGGCKRLRDQMYIENGTCRYAELLDELLPQLLSFAKRYMAQPDHINRQ